MSWGRGRVPRPQLRTVNCARGVGPMSHLGPGFERPQKHAVPNCLRISLPPLCPRLTSGITPTVWVERLSCLVSPPLSLSMVWYGSVPSSSSVEPERFSPIGGVTPGTARGVDEHFCHATQVRATRVPEHSGCCCFSSRHSAARCSRHAEGAGGLVEDVPVGHGESSGPAEGHLGKEVVSLVARISRTRVTRVGKVFR